MFSIRRILIRTNVLNVQVKHLRETKKDPGIKRVRKVLTQPGENEEIDDFDEFETDFMELHKTHRQHSEEIENRRELLKYHIVKQKYFKEKHPNFLTWHDKEQIKYLYNSNPEEWTVDKLSEGFPALPEVIAKIVKTKWMKKNQNKITNHDKVVQENWRLFKKGKLGELPDDLRDHLRKFTNRALNLKPFEAQQNKILIESQKKIGGEFSEIITSYEKLKNKDANTNKNVLLEEVESSKPKGDKQLATLHNLQKRIEGEIEANKDVAKEDLILVQGLKPKESVGIETIKLKQSDISIAQNKYTSVSTVTKTVRDYSHLIYPEKIVITKELKKKNGLYKLNDCFYDEYGDFLYRVPGMD
ncbi:unnamed protein product [Brassicogethes aeneus]|uniref:Neugrin n=1 Tax=Brassicogethes aeneus TaxID=1431903 RepID=A0A9P0FFC7_BRAAE|nr:unnamed protein product [Brassicogethes aeneus]